MSEQHRSRIYAWICELHDEPTAEYLMSCLAPAPVSDLVTREFLTAELSRFATKEEMHAGFAALRKEYEVQRAEDRRELAQQRAEDRGELAGQRAEDRGELAELRRELAQQRAEDRSELAGQRAEDRRAAQHRHYWQMGVILAATTPIWLDTFGIIG